MTRQDGDDLLELVRGAPDAPEDMSRETADPAALVEGFAALALALAPVAPRAALRERLLAAARAEGERFAPFAARLARLIDVTVERARELLATIVRPEAWQPLLPGVDLLHLAGGPAVAGADVGFVRVAAGRPFPEHRHLGDEHVLVLQGGYRDSSGEVFAAGALVDLPADSAHAFVALPEVDLIYAVVVGGVEFPGLPAEVTAAIADGRQG